MSSDSSIPHAARELGYIAVGFGVLGFQRLQVRRREIERAVRPAVRAARGILDEISDRTGVPLPCTSGRTTTQAK